jgi:HD-GYP domain-containing protein (c-di-GMP phosphodiesterase class II)
MKIEIEKSLLKSLFVLASVVEAKDPYTGGHLWRVSQFAQLLGNSFGLNKEENAALAIGAFIHDLGKVGIPESILGKKGKLDDYEYDVIKTHSDIGSQIIQSHPLSNLVYDVIRHHHETPNGLGYPDHLHSEQIKTFSKIVGICDAFDAMTSTRPYRKGMEIEKALNILEAEKGKQFDEKLVGIFLNISKDSLLHTIGHSEEGIPLLECPACEAPIQVQKITKDGDLGVCRACLGLFGLHADDKKGFEVTTFQRFGKAEELAQDSRVDTDMISSMVQSIPKTVELVEI